MLYNWLYPLHTQFSFLNVFRYQSFRIIYAAVTAFLITGAGVSIPELSLLTKLFKTPLILAYVASVFASAVALGFVLG